MKFKKPKSIGKPNPKQDEQLTETTIATLITAMCEIFTALKMPGKSTVLELPGLDRGGVPGDKWAVAVVPIPPDGVTADGKVIYWDGHTIAPSEPTHAS